MVNRDQKLTTGKKLFIAALSPLLIVALLLFLVCLPFYLLTRFAYRLTLRLWFEATFGVAGQRILLVYSRSPIWQEYIESAWLPRLQPHVVLLDWSDRKRWSRWRGPAVQLFRTYAGDRNFNPIALLFPKAGKVRVVRLHEAFRGWKHGKNHALRKAESEILSFVAELEVKSA